MLKTAQTSISLSPFTSADTPKNSISNNCVEVMNPSKVEINNFTVTNNPTNNNSDKSNSSNQLECQPNDDSSNDLPIEGQLAEEILAGEACFSKRVEELKITNEETIEDEIINEEILTNEEEILVLEDNEFEKQTTTENFDRINMDAKLYLVNRLKKRSIKCLNKMRIMEDVREACDQQPSSPGNGAEHEPITDIKLEPTTTLKENGTSPDQEIHEVKDDNTNDAIIPKRENCTDDDKPILTDDKTEDDSNSSNGDNSALLMGKRKVEEDVDEHPMKKLRSEIQDNFFSRDKILVEFMEMSESENVEQLQLQSEQVLSEIKTLNDLAREKEHEWNQIIHLKKLKEELLLRMQRKKQCLILNVDSTLTNEHNGDSHKQESLLKNNQNKSKLNKTRNILPKPIAQQFFEMNGTLLDFRHQQANRQRPILDVQSIIADYRQRHPETVPRRGRRIRHSEMDPNNKNNILSFSSMALGSGAQVRQGGNDASNDLKILLNALESQNRLDGSRSSSFESMSNMYESGSFKDLLVQFAKLSQNERNELIQNAIKPPPPPYPEVTVHPVSDTAPTNNSLLHGILTKTPTKTNSKSSFSPTLAKLLTAPERAAQAQLTSTPNVNITAGLNHPSGMSISEILSTSKARNEITITPVNETPVKGRTNMDDDEGEDNADRLVIDESNEMLGSRDNSSDAGDEVPQCQGCNQKTAQFVCAGCGNQWYCSRDCQVAAWDDHSEICSG